MKFGVILPNYGPAAGRLSTIDTALAAESLGYDSAWVTDHLALPESDGPTYTPILESISTCAYLAASTSRIRLGISALVLPQRNPYEVAKQVATIDVLSGGRTLLAVGTGWSKGEFANLGYPFAGRGKRADEGLRVLRTLWRGGQVISFHGEYSRFEKAQFSPGPIQAGGPPLWAAGNSPKALRRAAMLADGWHPVDLAAEQIADLLRVARPLLLNRPFEVAPRLTLALGAEAATERPHLAGSPQQVAARLRSYAEAGVSYVVLQFSGESQAERARAMRSFAREVMPQLAG
jgi:probable F420-dependent oxidoreductase